MSDRKGTERRREPPNIGDMARDLVYGQELSGLELAQLSGTALRERTFFELDDEWLRFAVQVKDALGAFLGYKDVDVGMPSIRTGGRRIPTGPEDYPKADSRHQHGGAYIYGVDTDLLYALFRRLVDGETPFPSSVVRAALRRKAEMVARSMEEGDE